MFRIPEANGRLGNLGIRGDGIVQRAIRRVRGSDADLTSSGAWPGEYPTMGN